jgi:FkbM family methyltransferase
MNADLGASVGEASRLIVASGVLQSRLVLVDVGCRDGINRRWGPIADFVDVYGFDAGVLEASTNPNHRYFQMAIGDYDGEVGFDHHSNPFESRVSPTAGHRVAMAKLDTLWAQGLLPLADFLKIDCEGFEPQVLRGAASYLAASNFLGAEVETNFCISPALPDSHFVEVLMPLLRERLVPTDLALDRPTPTGPLMRPGNCNALFARCLPEEHRSGPSYIYRPAEHSPSLDTILKCIIILELHGLAYPASVTLETFSAKVSTALDPAAIRDALHNTAQRQTAHNAVTMARPFYERLLPHLGLGILSGLRRAFQK